MNVLKVERVKRDWKQKDIEALTGIPQWRYSLLERGLPPRPEEALALAAALKMDLETLFPNSGRGEGF
jgi:transcriptional regulator with XRE-family HTH domain